MTRNSFISPYEYYLDILGTWAGNNALPSLWFVVIHLDSINVLKSNLSNFISSKESSMGNSGWNISNGTIRYLSDAKFQYATDKLIGCVFAKQVTLPGETLDFSHTGLNYSGYTSPIISNGRKPLNIFTINFLESNASFESLILRPWAVAASYNGAVARSENSPRNSKCKMVDVVFLAKTGYLSKMGIRKIFRFNNVYPTNIPGENYDYNKSTPKISAISFAFDTYAVLEQDTRNLISMT